MNQGLKWNMISTVNVPNCSQVFVLWTLSKFWPMPELMMAYLGPHLPPPILWSGALGLICKLFKHSPLFRQQKNVQNLKTNFVQNCFPNSTVIVGPSQNLHFKNNHALYVKMCTEKKDWHPQLWNPLQRELTNWRHSNYENSVPTYAGVNFPNCFLL